MADEIRKGSKSNLLNSSGSKAGSKTNISSLAKSTLSASKSNLLSSKNALAGSKGNLASSRFGSMRSLKNGAAGNETGDSNQTPAANAIVYENTYKLKPDKKYNNTSFFLKKKHAHLNHSLFGRVFPSLMLGLKKTFHRFMSGAVKKIIETSLSKYLTKAKYDFEKAPELSKTISSDILAAVKCKKKQFRAQLVIYMRLIGVWVGLVLEFDRYKLIVQVDIGEFKGQGIKVASRAVWDTTTDSYASASFKSANLFAVAMVFGCFYE